MIVAELLAVALVRGSVPIGGSSANPPPVVPGTNAPGLVAFVVDDFLACAKGILSLAIMTSDDVNNSTNTRTAAKLLFFNSRFLLLYTFLFVVSYCRGEKCCISV